MRPAESPHTPPKPDSIRPPTRAHYTPLVEGCTLHLNLKPHVATRVETIYLSTFLPLALYLCLFIFLLSKGEPLGLPGQACALLARWDGTRLELLQHMPDIPDACAWAAVKNPKALM